MEDNRLRDQADRPLSEEEERQQDYEGDRVAPKAADSDPAYASPESSSPVETPTNESDPPIIVQGG